MVRQEVKDGLEEYLEHCFSNGYFNAALNAKYFICHNKDLTPEEIQYVHDHCTYL